MTGATAPNDALSTTDAQLYGVTTGVTLDITRDLGETNQSELRVDVGAVLIAAQKAGDILLSGDDFTMVAPEELAFAMNKFFAAGYDVDNADSDNDVTTGLDTPTGAGFVGNVTTGAATTRDFSDLKVEYDFARQAMRDHADW